MERSPTDDALRVGEKLILRYYFLLIRTFHDAISLLFCHAYVHHKCVMEEGFDPIHDWSAATRHVSYPVQSDCSLVSQPPQEASPMSISCVLIDINTLEDDQDFPFTVSDLITTCKDVGSMSADE